jgi:hypothetical protein
VADCTVCGWRDASRRGRCGGCRAFYRRNGRDRTVEEVARNWNLQIDRVAAPFQAPTVNPAPTSAPVRVTRVDPAELEAAIARLSAR